MGSKSEVQKHRSTEKVLTKIYFRFYF